MGKKRDINKVKAVAKEYLNNGMNMTKALKAVNDTGCTQGSLYVKAHQWRLSPEIQAEIKAELALFDEKIADKVYCIANLFDIINTKDTKPADRINAVNVLAKLIGYTEQGNTTNITFDLSALKTQLNTVKSIPIDTSIVSSNSSAYTSKTI